MKKGVGLAFFADGGGGAVAGEDAGVFREGEEAVADGLKELTGVSAGEVGAADGAGEEGVSGEQEIVVGEMEAEAPFGVAGGVEDVAGDAGLVLSEVGAEREGAVVGGAEVGRQDFRGGDVDPAGLGIHHGDEGEIELVVEDGRAGDGLELLGAGDVVDVGVGDEDVLHGEAVFREEEEDAGDIVAGVDDDGFAGESRRRGWSSCSGAGRRGGLRGSCGGRLRAGEA